MHIEIVMPKMGESIQEGKILQWMKKIGERIEKEETLLEISTDKVDSEIPSPAAGVLVEIRAKENDVVPVGAVIAIVETDIVTENTALQESAINFNAENQSPEVSVQISGETYSSNRKEKAGRFYSPLVRTIAEKEKISNQELDAIVGTGNERPGQQKRYSGLLYAEGDASSVCRTEGKKFFPAVCSDRRSSGKISWTAPSYCSSGSCSVENGGTHVPQCRNISSCDYRR